MLTLNLPMASPSAAYIRRSPTTNHLPRPRSSTVSLAFPSSAPTQNLSISSSSSSQNPKPLQNHSSSASPCAGLINSADVLGGGLVKSSAVVGVGVGLFVLFNGLSKTFVFGGGSSGGGGFFGGGGGGGGGGGNFWSTIFGSPAIAGEEETEQWNHHGLPANIKFYLKKLSGFKKYKVSEIEIYDRSRRETVEIEDSFFEMVSLRPGGIYTKSELQKELDTLSASGMFEKIDFEGKTNPDGTIGITLAFSESTWESAERFKCINVGLMQQSQPIEVNPKATDKEKFEYYRKQEREYKNRVKGARPCMLPMAVQDEIQEMLREEKKLSARMLQRIRDKVQQWYIENGFACAQVVNFGNLNTKEVVCEVVEGDITRVDVQFIDKLGNVCEGNTQPAVVKREIPKELEPGKVFNFEAGKQALRKINSLSLFSNIEINPRPDEEKDGGIIIEVKLKEMQQKSADVTTEWTIVPGRNGRPTLASIKPGGTVSFEHKNLKGLNRSLAGSVTTSDFLNPQDDLGFKLEYSHPYLDGVFNPRNRMFHVSCFNSRKLSPVFTGGPGVDEVPPIWVDRAGVKANIIEDFTRQSKFTFGLVAEEITTRDESNQISTHAQRVLPTGGIRDDGPPTTLSGTGTDSMAFLQANITRDNTEYVNGALVGQRNIFQFDQGLGIGSKFPFFNRHKLTMTRFIPLKKVEEGVGKAPPLVLVLHGHYGGCVGDLPNYEAFTLGGPNSVRGYNMGEIAAARNILELAAELRIPVRGAQVYTFAEHGNDLGSSKDVKGNPTKVYGRAGHGTSYGVGVKLGSARLEYAVDHNSRTGAVFLRFGERF